MSPAVGWPASWFLLRGRSIGACGVLRTSRSRTRPYVDETTLDGSARRGGLRRRRRPAGRTDERHDGDGFRDSGDRSRGSCASASIDVGEKSAGDRCVHGMRVTGGALCMPACAKLFLTLGSGESPANHVMPTQPVSKTYYMCISFSYYHMFGAELHA